MRKIVALLVLGFFTMSLVPCIAGFTPYDTLSFYCRAEVQSPAPVFSSESPSNGTTGVSISTVNLSVVIETVSGGVFDWTIQTVPDIGSSSASGELNGTKVVNVSGNLSYSSSYTWFVNATNTTTGFWNNETYTFNTADPVGLTWASLSFYTLAEVQNNAPVVTSESPGNGSTGVELFTPVSVTVDEQQGDLFNISWYENASTGSWIPYAWNNSCVNGSYSQPYNYSNLSSTTYYWRVCINDTNGFWNNQTYSFTTGSFNWSGWSSWWIMSYVPVSLEPPSSFVVKHVNNSIMNFTWSNQADVNYTYVVRKVNSTPSNTSDGTIAYNGTASGFNNTGLFPGTHYYYGAWGYNESIDAFSYNVSTGDNYTSPGDPSYLHETSVAMTTISLEWNMGVNATRSVVRRNSTGSPTPPSTPQSGVSVYNGSNNYATASSLTPNVTYNFSVWSYNPDSTFFSDGNSTDSATTVESADSPSNLNVLATNDTRITLSWTKGADYTTILRKTGSYPTSVTDGTIVYNGSGNSYNNINLNPATHYYYRAWGWNGFNHSAGYTSDENITWPSPPDDFVGNIEGNNLNITWTMGTGADRTIIRNATASFPADITDGYLQYNGTGTNKIIAGIDNIDYFRGWSYTIVDGENLYSEPVNLIWGGLEINVYSENDPSINITNYTVFITNNDNTETFQNTSQNNPTRIGVRDVPNGADTIVQISDPSGTYETRTIYIDLYENQWYSLNVYLPLALPPGGTTDPEYDPVNNTYSLLYYIQVIDDYSQPLEDVKVTISRYINTTDSYEELSIKYTDSYGQIQEFLLPGTIYAVLLEKNDYDTVYEPEYQPDPIFYGIYYPKIFQMNQSAVEVDVFTFWNIISFNATMFTNSSMVVYYTDSLTNTSDVQFYVYETYNFSETFISNFSTTDQSYVFWVNGINNSRQHRVYIHLNHTNLGYEVTSIIVLPARNVSYDEQTIEEIIEEVTGDFDLDIILLLFVYIPSIIILVFFGKKHPGLGTIGSGLWIAFIGIMVNIPLEAYALAPFIVGIGMIITAVKGGWIKI